MIVYIVTQDCIDGDEMWVYADKDDAVRKWKQLRAESASHPVGPDNPGCSEGIRYEEVIQKGDEHE